MKSLSVRLAVILIIGLAIFGYTEVWGADWKLYYSHKEYLGYYDTQNITRPSKNVVRVWTRWDFTEKGVLTMVGEFGKKYENLSWSVISWEIDCAEKKYRQLSSTRYDHKGSVISSRGTPSEWRFIIPESVITILYEEVCK
jgi:hypothetical protein